MSIQSPYPCGYCGGKSKISGKRTGKYHRTGTLYYVMCNSCKCKGPQFRGEAGEFEQGAFVGGNVIAKIKAIDAWNILMSKK